MKQVILFFTLAALAFTSCTNTGKQQNGQATDASTTTAEMIAYDADTLYAIAESFVDQPITVKGYVTHTCKHAGKRCFITGENQEFSIRVEAKGDIGGFNRELAGSQLEIEGVLRERRLTQTEIADMEMDVNERMKQVEDGTAETCEAELANINEMREWMEAQGKDYYAIYYIDGLDYREVSN